MENNYFTNNDSILETFCSGINVQFDKTIE